MSRKWSDHQIDFEDDDFMYGDTMKRVSKKVRKIDDGSNVSADRWERVEKNAFDQGSRRGRIED